MESYLKVYESSENSNKNERIQFVVDEKSKRIIEQTIYKIHDSSSSIFDERVIYTYNDIGKISQIIRVFKSHISNSEYLHLDTRQVKQNSLSGTYLTSEVIISRDSFIGRNRKNRIRKHIYLEHKSDHFSNEIFTKPKYIIAENKKAFFYFYSKENPNELNLIKEYRILLDLRIINKFLNIFELPMLTWLLSSFPPILIKKLLHKNKVIANNGYEKIKRKEQDYLSNSFIGNIYDCNINEILFTEDYFLKENFTLKKMYSELSK